MKKSNGMDNEGRKQEIKLDTVSISESNSNATFVTNYAERESVSLSLSFLPDEDTLPSKMKDDISSIYEGLNKLLSNCSFLRLEKDSEEHIVFPKNDHNNGLHYTWDRYAGSIPVKPWKEIGYMLYDERITPPNDEPRYSVRNSLEKQLIAHNYKLESNLIYSLGYFTMASNHFVPRLERDVVEKFKDAVLEYFNKIKSQCETKETREEAKKISEMNEWRTRDIRAMRYK